MLNKEYLEGIELGVMLALVLGAYVVGMIIQLRENKERKFDLWDWILALLSSLIFSTITYFIVFKWINIGLRIGATVFSSLRAYAIMKFIFSNDGESGFIQLFKKKVGFGNANNNDHGNT